MLKYPDLRIATVTNKTEEVSPKQILILNTFC